MRSNKKPYLCMGTSDNNFILKKLPYWPTQAKYGWQSMDQEKKRIQHEKMLICDPKFLNLKNSRKSFLLFQPLLLFNHLFQLKFTNLNNLSQYLANGATTRSLNLIPIQAAICNISKTIVKLPNIETFEIFLARTILMNKIVSRIIMNAGPRASSVKLFNKLNWIPFYIETVIAKCSL